MICKVADDSLLLIDEWPDCCNSNNTELSEPHSPTTEDNETWVKVRKKLFVILLMCLNLTHSGITYYYTYCTWTDTVWRKQRSVLFVYSSGLPELACSFHFIVVFLIFFFLIKYCKILWLCLLTEVFKSIWFQHVINF